MWLLTILWCRRLRQKASVHNLHSKYGIKFIKVSLFILFSSLLYVFVFCNVNKMEDSVWEFYTQIKVLNENLNKIHTFPFLYILSLFYPLSLK